MDAYFFGEGAALPPDFVPPPKIRRRPERFERGRDVELQFRVRLPQRPLHRGGRISPRE